MNEADEFYHKLLTTMERNDIPINNEYESKDNLSV